MRKTTAFLLSAVLSVSLILSGCNNNNESEKNSDITADEPEEPTPYPFTLNNTEITAKPEKVVCLSPALAEIIYELGYSDTIIGRSSYCDYPPEITSVKDIGSTANPDMEAITELEPDLVISSTPIASKDIFALEQVGIKTLIIPAPTTLEGFFSIYTSLGLVFEGIFVGTEKGEETYSEISKLLGNTENLNIGSFVYITENLAIAGGNTFESAVLSCFGTNLAKESEGYQFDPATLAENQPDIILVNAKYDKELLSENEYFADLTALEEDKIIYIDNVFFERPSGRIKDAINTLISDYKKLKNEM